MNVKVSLTTQDYRDFYHVSVGRIYTKSGLLTKKNVFQIIQWVLIGFAVAGFLNFYDSCNQCNLKHLNTAIFTLIIWFLFAMSIQKWEMTKFVSYATDDKGFFLREKEYEITDECIIERSEVHTSNYSWSAIDESVETKNHYLLYMDVAVALIIPKQVLSEEQKTTLLQWLNEKEISVEKHTRV
jgi:hypothetical protein